MEEKQGKKNWIKERIMVIVPHQDDEILMTAGVIREAVKKGASVTVVMATNGDCECRDYSKGRNRLLESLKGLELLGLEAGNFWLMGYADTGMAEEDSFLHHLYCEADAEKIYPSFCSSETYGLLEKEEYHMRQYGEHADYCRGCFKADLKEIIEKQRPEQIFTTSEFDTHGDHSALYKFVCEVLDELQETDNEEAQGSGEGEPEAYTPEVFVSVVHSMAGDENWPLRGTPRYSCPEGLEEAAGLKWDERICLHLPEEMRTERGGENLKYRALCRHETALEPNAVDFLMAFIKDEEIFWRVR
ncbi:MAG: PIG-L family deacetylase [Lachnospiraceae bacterium]|nr:PIG-L family deacetylase [Lachnospiraceae bacterium]